MSCFGFTMCFFILIFGSHGNKATMHLTILHSNDIHGNFAGDDDGYGGIPKTIYMVKKVKEATTPDRPVIYLNAGDIFTGTVWYSIHRTDIAADFIKLMKPDALTLGNHEFDEGLKGLERFASKIDQPILCANGDFTNEPNISKYMRRSVVLKPNNSIHEIGVIGYINSGTGELADTGGIRFSNDIDAVKEEAVKLTKKGVKVIIALGHSGIETDKKLAEVVPEVDVVVGGHSHTFLYTGQPPTREKVYGDYPIVIERSNGVKVPVVQVGYGGRYLGRLNVSIDSKGNVVNFEGGPMLLGGDVAQDEQALELLNHYRPAVDALLLTIVGRSQVYLQGGLGCRRSECNLGNLMTDAFCEYKADMAQGPHWTNTPIAILNAGSLRSSINASKRAGNVTKGDLLSSLPFSSKLVSLSLNSSALLQTLEFSVKSNGETSFGEFLQVSGLRVSLNMLGPPFSRVKNVLVRCADCDVPSFHPLKEDEVYRLITTEYLAGGGDGYKILKEAKMNVKEEHITDSEVLLKHLESKQSVHTSIEDRIMLTPHVPRVRTVGVNASGSQLNGKSIISVLVTISVVINSFG